jgi:NAD(P)H-dependent nitrite reductase small subunit
MAAERPVDRWEDVGPADGFTHRKGKEVRIGARQIAVFRENDTFYAIKNICPHAAELLHFGTVEEIDGRLAIKCPAHGWCFALEDGKSAMVGIESRVASYPVKIEDGRVLIGV